jgi:hypothetical protein
MRQPKPFIIAVAAVMLIGCANKDVGNRNANTNINANHAVQTPTPTPGSDETKRGSDDFDGTTGITDKKPVAEDAALLKEIRIAAHQNFDRIVFEFAGATLPGYHVEYIDQPARQCGAGDAVDVKGQGRLEIRFMPANAHTDEGKSTIATRAFSPNLTIVKELKSTCDFEAEVAWVAGVSSPNKYRVLELTNPTRLAIDIKH